MVQLLIATTNRGKQCEFQDLLADWPVETVSPQDLGIDIEIEEKEHSFAEIAAHKARVYAKTSGLLTLADDSGLQVDALAGAPGIYTARYAGPAASDRDRYQKLLAELGDTPAEKRTARFCCAIALAQPDGAVHVVQGVCEGVIAPAPQGNGGFGYDPVFYLPEYGCTMAQVGDAIKNQISHRARAVQNARNVLDDLIQTEVAAS